MVNIDLIIISLFLILTLIIGIYYGAGVKTFQDYAVGGRKMSTAVITLSLIATIYGGGILSSRLDAHYQLGLYACILDLTSPINIYLASRFIVVRMKEFIGHLSIAESMESIYGSTGRMVTAVLGIIMSIASLATQINVGLKVTTVLLPEIAKFSNYATILLTLFIVIYSTFGGARAVALTDVYQFLLFGLCFPVLTFILIYSAKDRLMGCEQLIDNPSFNPYKVCIWNDALTSILAHSIWRSIFPFDPARMQRFYMAHAIPQAVKVFNRTAIIRILMPFLFFSVALALHIGGHRIPSSQSVFHYIIQLSYFPGMRGFLITAIFALLMSTADSYLHAASVLFANDLWPNTKRRAKLGQSLHALKVVRIVSVCIGIISLLVVWNKVHTNYLYATMHLYGLSVTIPFIMACIGFRTRPMALLLTMGINTALLGYHYCREQTISTHNYFAIEVLSSQDTFKTLILSAIILVVTHYVLPKQPHTGWIGIKDRSAWDLQNQTTKRWWVARLQQLKAPLTRHYREYIFPKTESSFVLFGIYIIISTTIALCFMKKAYFFPYIYGYMMVMAIGTILALYPAFHSYQRGGSPLLYWLWPGLLFILLFIVPLQFVKLGHYGPMVCALWICSLGLGGIFLSLEVSIVMLAVALCIHNYLPPSLPFWTFFSDSYKYLSIEPIYAIALIASAVVGMATYKRLHNKLNAMLKIIELTRTYEHRISLEAIYNQSNWSRLDAIHESTLLREMGQKFQETCQHLYTQGQEKLEKEIFFFTRKLHKFSNLLLWRAKEERSLKLNQKSVKEVSIQSAIGKAYQTIHGKGACLQLLLHNQTPILHLQADTELFECLIMLNLWEISKSIKSMDYMVALTIADTTLQYDYAVAPSSGQRALVLPALAFCFSTDAAAAKILPAYAISQEMMPLPLPSGEEEFYQIESRQMVEAHGGYVEIITKSESLTCLYVLPVNGQKVMRFKTYDPADLVINKTAETEESVAQEKELVNLLTHKTTLNQETVEKTIAFIKNAHGLVIRKSGAPYYTHPMAVVKLLLEVTQDPDTILAGLLHDIVEDTPITLNQIEMMYGQEIAAIVDKLTEYNTNGYPWKLEAIEQKNILDTCGDMRVVALKLADRLHNMRTLYARKPDDQQRIARETLTFYIPWGKRNKGPNHWLREMQGIGEEILQQK